MNLSMEHIAVDQKKFKRLKLNRVILSVYLPIAALTLALVMRPDQIGFEDPIFWFFGVSHLLLLSLISYFMLSDLDQSNKKYRFIWVLSTILLAILSLRPGAFGFELEFFAEYDYFSETRRCFIYGLFAAFVSGVLVYRSQFRVSRPDRYLVVALSLLPAYVGLTMLNIHCLYDDLGHIFISHWLPGIFSFFIMGLIGALLLKRKNARASSI